MYRFEQRCGCYLNTEYSRLFLVFFAPSPHYSHRDTEHALIQILLKNHCSKNVSPWKNDNASASGRYLCEQSLWGNTFHQSVLGREWLYCSTVPHKWNNWMMSQSFGHCCSIFYWFYCGWTSADRKNIYKEHYKSVWRFKIKCHIPKDSHPEGANWAFMEKNMNEPWCLVQKENVHAAPILETGFLNPHHFEFRLKFHNL